jgi:tetratricopeptide (TPR) repeat protein
MSTTTQPQPLSNRTTTVVNETSAVDSIQIWYEKNKKIVTGAVIALLVIVVGYIGYTRFYMAPRETKAAAKVYYAEQYFAADSFQRALQGDGQHPGFVKVLRDYSGTKTANLCHYYAGICYLRTGDAKKAITQLEDFNGKGTLLEVAAAGALGAAYMDNGNTKKAIEQFEKASANKEDNVQTPMYLMSLGTAYEMDKKPEDAKKAYQRIRDEYPASMQARDIDRNLARLGDLN